MTGGALDPAAGGFHIVLMIEGGAIDWAAHSNQSGRVIEELTVDAPHPRTEAFRTSPDYAAQCRAASEALHAAMAERNARIDRPDVNLEVRVAELPTSPLPAARDASALCNTC